MTMRKPLEIILNVSYFKRLFLVNSLLFTFYFWTPKMATITSYFFAIWAFGLILYNLVQKKFDFRKKSLLWLFLFVVVNVISVLLNFRSAFMDNVKTLVNTVITFGIIYYLPEDGKAAKDHFATYARIAVVYTFIMSLVSLVFYALGIHIARYTGRYCGVYANPIMSGIAGNVGIAFALYLLLRKKNGRKTKILLIVQIAIQTVIVAISSTRSAIICFITFFIAFAWLGILYFTKLKVALKIGALVLSGAIIVLGSSGLNVVIRESCYFINDFVYKQLNKEQINYENELQKIKDDNALTEEEKKQMLLELEEKYKDINKGSIFDDFKQAPTDDDRGDTLSESSSIRLNLIKAGLNTFTKHPLFGVNPRNLASAVKAENTGLDLTGIDGGGVHNSYLQILVSVGIVGFAIFAIFAIKAVIASIRLLKRERESSSGVNMSTLCLIAFLAGMAVFSLFESSLLFTISLPAISFWLTLGNVMGKADGDEAAGSHENFAQIGD